MTLWQATTPEPGPGEVLVRVMACGICGTDVHFIGVTFGGDTLVPVDLQMLHFRRAQLRSSYAIPDTRWPLALDLLRSREIDPEMLITHVFRLSEVDRALAVAGAPDQPVGKVVVDCR